MARLIKWPDIEQYRSTVHNVVHSAHYIGKDENGDPIYDKTRNSPTLKFEGTVKLHGTNAAVCFGYDNEEWCQSRENIITVEKDNAGFAMFVNNNKQVFQDITNAVALLRDIPVEKLLNEDVAIYGEWCGKGIQDTVAITQLPRMFVIFGIAFVNSEGKKTYLTRQQVEATIGWKRWGSGSEFNPAAEDITGKGRIFSIYDFPSFQVTIDFNKPHEFQNGLNDMTAQVEAECPVAKAFGVSGLGEGIVWRCIEEGYEDSGYWFKVKGDKHSGSKVKMNATVDVERINNIHALCETLSHTGRLAQMYQKVFDTLNGGQPDIKRMGEFIKAVMADILKEELDTIAASGFTTKDITGPISKITRDYLLEQLEV
jgi:hypothetical protein